MTKVLKVNEMEQWSAFRLFPYAQVVGETPDRAEIVGDEAILVLASHPHHDWLYRAVTIDGCTVVTFPGDSLVRLLEPGDTTMTGIEIDIDMEWIGRLQVAYNAGMLDLRSRSERRQDLPVSDVLGWTSTKPKYPDRVYGKMVEINDWEDMPNDELIAKVDAMSEDEIFDAFLTYEGIIGYGTKLRRWVEDIYKVGLRRVNY